MKLKNILIVFTLLLLFKSTVQSQNKIDLKDIWENQEKPNTERFEALMIIIKNIPTLNQTLYY